MSTPCERMLPLIVRAAEGALDAAGRSTLDEHAASCVACREALSAQTTVRRALRELPFDEVSPDFAIRVRARIERRPAIFDLVNWRWWSLRLAPLAAVLAMLAWGPWPVETTWTLAAAEQAWAAGGSTEPETTGRAAVPGAILFDDAVDSYDLVSVALEEQPQ